MFDISTEEKFQDGQIVFEEGNSGDWIYLVESGAVEIYKMVGEEKVVINVLQPGDIFGEVAFLAGIPRTASARAIGPTTLGVLDREFIDQDFNRLSSGFRMLLRSLVLRLVQTSENAAKSKLRRKNPRVPKVLSLSFKSRKGFINAFSNDISTGGIFIKTSTPLPKGEQFVLKLQLPGISEPFKIEGKVSWTRTETKDPVQNPLGMGIEFIGLTSSDRRKIKEVVIQNGLK